MKRTSVVAVLLVAFITASVGVRSAHADGPAFVSDDCNRSVGRHVVGCRSAGRWHRLNASAALRMPVCGLSVPGGIAHDALNTDNAFP